MRNYITPTRNNMFEMKIYMNIDAAAVQVNYMIIEFAKFYPILLSLIIRSIEMSNDLMQKSILAQTVYDCEDRKTFIKCRFLKELHLYSLV